MEKSKDNFIRSIFATDAVGFSKLVSQNEYETLASLKDCLSIISETLVSHGGRIFHSAGDSVLAEFANSDDACSAAIVVQRQLGEQRQKTNLQKIEFRIGLDIGEVFADGENLLGEAVNFAARLESFAQPNGISVSKRFYNSLSSQHVYFNDHGLQTIKNSNIHCLDLVLPNLKKRRKLSNKQKLISKIFSIFAFFILTLTVYMKLFNTEYERSSVAVLPIINDTGDKTLDYVSTGITSEISGALSQISTMDVISNNSVNLISLEELTLEQIVDNFALDHLFWGNLVSQGNQLKLIINLFEAKSNAKTIIYSETGSINELLEKRNIFVQSAIEAIDVPISKSDLANATRQGTTNIKAYENFLLGDYHFKLRTPYNLRIAKDYFEESIAIDPSFARPYGYLALLFATITDAGFDSDFGSADIQNGLYFADLLSRAATSIGPNIPEVFFARAFLETLHFGQYPEALKNSEIALMLKPSYADAMGMKATTLNALRKPEEALIEIQRAKRLNPNFSFEYLLIETVSHLLLEDWPSAKHTAVKTLERLPENIDAKVMLICADVSLGNMEDAAWNYEEIFIYAPDFRLETWSFGQNQSLINVAREAFSKLEAFVEN